MLNHRFGLQYSFVEHFNRPCKWRFLTCAPSRRFVEPTKRFANIIIPHHGVFADPGHLLAVGDGGVQAYATGREAGEKTDVSDAVEEVRGNRESAVCVHRRFGAQIGFAT